MPAQQTAMKALAELVAEVQICERMSKLCMRACELLLSQVAHSFFMPFCLTASAAISTLRISASSHLMQCITIYNNLVPVAASLPRRLSCKAAGSLFLPESLGVQWIHGLPCVVGHLFSTSDGFQQLGLRLGAQHDVCYTAEALQTHAPGLALTKNTR